MKPSIIFQTKTFYIRVWLRKKCFGGYRISMARATIARSEGMIHKRNYAWTLGVFRKCRCVFDTWNVPRSSHAKTRWNLRIIVKRKASWLCWLFALLHCRFPLARSKRAALILAGLCASRNSLLGVHLALWKVHKTALKDLLLCAMIKKTVYFFNFVLFIFLK